MNAILKILASILAFLPKKLFYLLADGIAFVLKSIVRYRRTTIINNISIIQPQLSKSSQNLIIHRFYKNLADVMLETIALGAMPPKRLLDMVEVENPAILAPFVQQRLLVAGGHTANWEIAAATMGATINRPVYGVYKAIKNPAVERFYQQSRALLGMVPTPMAQAARTIINASEPNFTMGLIADQHSSNLKKSFWISFFNRPTCFLPGLELLAKKYNIPVVFASCTRLNRGKYRITYSVIAAHPKAEPAGNITKKYGAKLEEAISQNPHEWLLSHKRWKAEKPTTDLAFDFSEA